MKPPEEFKELCHNLGKRYIYNSSKYQHIKSLLCGYFCLYYIKESENGKSCYEILFPFSKKDSKINELLIIKYFSE